jgi:hypothetical protein
MNDINVVARPSDAKLGVYSQKRQNYYKDQAKSRYHGKYIPKFVERTNARRRVDMNVIKIIMLDYPLQIEGKDGLRPINVPEMLQCLERDVVKNIPMEKEYITKVRRKNGTSYTKTRICRWTKRQNSRYLPRTQVQIISEFTQLMLHRGKIYNVDVVIDWLNNCRETMADHVNFGKIDFSKIVNNNNFSKVGNGISKALAILYDLIQEFIITERKTFEDEYLKKYGVALKWDC